MIKSQVDAYMYNLLFVKKIIFSDFFWCKLWIYKPFTNMICKLYLAELSWTLLSFRSTNQRQEMEQQNWDWRWFCVKKSTIEFSLPFFPGSKKGLRIRIHLLPSLEVCKHPWGKKLCLKWSSSAKFSMSFAFLDKNLATSLRWN